MRSCKYRVRTNQTGGGESVEQTACDLGAISRQAQHRSKRICYRYQIFRVTFLDQLAACINRKVERLANYELDTLGLTPQYESGLFFDEDCYI